MQKNIDDIRQNLDEIAQIIAQTVPVESIYLFGSYAYGYIRAKTDAVQAVSEANNKE